MIDAAIAWDSSSDTSDAETSSPTTMKYTDVRSSPHHELEAIWMMSDANDAYSVLPEGYDASAVLTTDGSHLPVELASGSQHCHAVPGSDAAHTSTVTISSSHGNVEPLPSHQNEAHSVEDIHKADDLELSFANLSLHNDTGEIPPSQTVHASEALTAARKCLYSDSDGLHCLSTDTDQPASDDDRDDCCDLSNITGNFSDRNEDDYLLLDSDFNFNAEPANQESTKSFLLGKKDNHYSEELNDDLNSVKGFQHTRPPPMLSRHPPPAMGRDDDIEKIKEVLDDIYLRSGQIRNSKDRVILAPDNKISKNILKLLKTGDKYKTFLVEFPVLHLRKSKINSLGSAYEAAGIKKVVKYMKDDETHWEWSKIVTLEQIDSATRVIKRLSQALHIAFVIKYLEYLPRSRAKVLRDDLADPEVSVSEVTKKWHDSYEEFLAKYSQQNATFAIHRDILTHCDEVAGLHFAERISGHQGYCLLLAMVKQSLPFAFLNGASQYATFCCDMLYQHASASPFHQKQKEALFSVPYKGSKTNFALDAIREMEHRDAMKGFRPRAQVSAVLPRMSLVDTFNDIATKRESQGDTSPDVAEDQVKWKMTQRDNLHVQRAVSLLLRRGGLNSDTSMVPQNVYDNNQNTDLPTTILDSCTEEVVQYLALKHACKEGMFGLSIQDLPDPHTVEGPTSLTRKVVSGKSFTIKRLNATDLKVMKSSLREAKELKRLKNVKKIQSEADCLSSAMNTCQALLKPDCTKPTIAKSATIKTAIRNVLGCATNNTSATSPLMYSSMAEMPQTEKTGIKVIVVEFAGIKFRLKDTIKTGAQYIYFVQDSVIKHLLYIAPSAERVIICEEKYKFTPNSLKAPTRAKRQKTNDASISHLKTNDEIVSTDVIYAGAIKSTNIGRIGIGNYLAEHAGEMTLSKELIVDIDSEFILKTCHCHASTESECCCDDDKRAYTTPIRHHFHASCNVETEYLDSIIQRKGDAEMSQVDWVMDCIKTLQPGDVVLSVVSSGDIDALIIHLFALSHLWPRDSDGIFTIPVYLYLQIFGIVYNVTHIIQKIEAHYQEPMLAMKMAMALCLGGNDFIPKYHGFSHDTILKEFLDATDMRQD